MGLIVKKITVVLSDELVQLYFFVFFSRFNSTVTRYFCISYIDICYVGHNVITEVARP